MAMGFELDPPCGCGHTFFVGVYEMCMTPAVPCGSYSFGKLSHIKCAWGLLGWVSKRLLAIVIILVSWAPLNAFSSVAPYILCFGCMVGQLHWGKGGGRKRLNDWEGEQMIHYGQFIPLGSWRWAFEFLESKMGSSYGQSILLNWREAAGNDTRIFSSLREITLPQFWRKLFKMGVSWDKTYFLPLLLAAQN